MLPLPDNGHSITIIIMDSPRFIVNDQFPEESGLMAKCFIFGKVLIIDYDIKLSPSIYKEISKELKKHDIKVDTDLKCLVGRMFTITGRQMPDNKEITYDVKLRLDLEQEDTWCVVWVSFEK